MFILVKCTHFAATQNSLKERETLAAEIRKTTNLTKWNMEIDWAESGVRSSWPSATYLRLDLSKLFTKVLDSDIKMSGHESSKNPNIGLH